MTKDEKDLFVEVTRRRVDALLKEMAPDIKTIAIADCLTFVNIERVRGEAVERVLRRWSTAIDNAARGMVERLEKL